MDLIGKPKLCALKSLVLAAAEILKGNAKILEAPIALGYAHFFAGYDFMMALGKPQQQANFDVAGFIYYGNVRKFVFSLNWDKPKCENLFWKTHFTMFPIKCITFVELQLQKIDDFFYEKLHF